MADINLPDLLGRTEYGSDDDPAIRQALEGKRVVITGAGGSIGSMLCNLIIKHKPSLLVMVDISEHALFPVWNRLASEGEPVKALIGDVRDLARMIHVTEGADLVFHAAAMKHVGLCEANVCEAIRTNVEGTWNVMKAAPKGATRVLVSTDKSVKPTNVMGRTKALAEVFWEGPIVRLVNVIGSSGSLLPLALERLRDHQPIMVYGEETTRYFMTPGEAARTCIYALGHNGVTVPPDEAPINVAAMIRRIMVYMGVVGQIRFLDLPQIEKKTEDRWWQFERVLTPRETSTSIGGSVKHVYNTIINAEDAGLGGNDARAWLVIKRMVRDIYER